MLIRRLVALAAFALYFSSVQPSLAQDASDPFARWESTIQKFEADDKEHPKKSGQVLFIGSSSIRLWDLKKWFPDIDAINRGFGGSEVADSVHFYDRIVKPYAPRVIVMYAGDNDLSRKKTPERVRDDFQEFVAKAHRDFPETQIVYVAVKPSLKRWNLIESVRATNALITEMAEKDDHLTFLDIDAPMIGEDGTPKKELFAKDGLHLSDAGYKLWSDLLRPLILPQEARTDARLKPLRNIYDKYHPWSPPASLQAWESEAARIRRQILVSNGLWPLPAKTPLNAVVHGKIDMGDYTVEKVFFGSRPGHYVCGNLYRPKQVEGKIPGILSPHGHWTDARFYDSDKGAKAQLESGAEEFEAGARFPLQARMVQLAKMGCIVFHYDMIGYSDSKPLDHRTGFNDAQAALRLHNLMGLQTWNSIRALDFLESLPEVDSERLAVTGASGGGTQTMLLGAVDPRVDVVFPAVMVSTGMQGGCVCENASYLRQGINNVAIAALFAPKPQAMSGADDWTIEIETKGLPELKHVYALYGHPELVAAKAFPQFKHNYNQVSREVMYNWFNEHLNLGLQAPVKQSDFKPLSREQLTVFDDNHPLPADVLTAEKLRALMTQEDQAEFADLLKGDEKAYREVVGGAVDVMLSPEIEEPGFVDGSVSEVDGIRVLIGAISHAEGAMIPVKIVSPQKPERGTVYLFDGHKLTSELSPVERQYLENGYHVVTAQLFLTEGTDVAEHYEVNKTYPGYTYCYNRPLITERVRDILSVFAAVPAQAESEVILVGDGQAGLWALLAASVLPEKSLTKIVVDLEGFRFSDVSDIQDPNLLPGALKYGGTAGIARLINAAPVTLFGVKDIETFQTVAKSDDIHLAAESLDAVQLAKTVLTP